MKKTKGTGAKSFDAIRQTCAKPEQVEIRQGRRRQGTQKPAKRFGAVPMPPAHASLLLPLNHAPHTA